MKKVLLLMAAAVMSVSITFAQADDKAAKKAAKEAAKAFLTQFGAYEVAMERYYDHALVGQSIRMVVRILGTSLPTSGPGLSARSRCMVKP